MYDKLIEILSAEWLISRDTVIQHIPLFLSFLKGNTISASLANEKNKPFVISPKSFLNHKGSVDINTCDRDDLKWEPDEIEPNSIAIIPMSGALFASDTMDIMRSIQMAEANDNVIGWILLSNSPGGMVFMTDLCANSIVNAKKANAGYGMNVVASAAMWSFSGTKRRFLSSRIDRAGSIGVMTSFTDWKGLLANFGVDMFDIYATLSTRKNEEVRALLDKTKTMEERTAMIVKDLDFTNQIFHEEVAKNLNIPLTSEVFTGAMYRAEEAISMGLADEINTFEYALEWVYNEGLKNQINNLLNINRIN